MSFIFFTLVFLLQSQFLALLAGGYYYHYKIYHDKPSLTGLMWVAPIQAIAIFLWLFKADCNHITLLAMSSAGALTIFFATYFLEKKILSSEKKLSIVNVTLSLVYLVAYIAFITINLKAHYASIDCG